MAKLIPIRYKGISYPDGIDSEIDEESAPLWIPHLKRFTQKYSLHTDPSGRPQQYYPLLDEFQTLRTANVEGIPQLWFNKQWAEEFADFIAKVVDKNRPPLMVEIHPPYKDYCASVEQFLETYRVFEDRISSFYPGTEILIENRYGTQYKRSPFLISSYGDVVDLVNQLERTELGLGLVLDLPQLLDQIGMSRLTIAQLRDIFSSLFPCRRKIRSIHLWGHRMVVDGHFRGVHREDLNGLFQGDKLMKTAFLKELYELLNDDTARYFVSEVGGNRKEENDKRVKSIVDDLISAGFVF